MKAIWNNEIIAESDDTVVVENNHYFPKSSLVKKYFEESEHTSVCGWKGTAKYYTVSVEGKSNINSAWYYPSPKEKAQSIADRVAFWRGIEIVS